MLVPVTLLEIVFPMVGKIRLVTVELLAVEYLVVVDRISLLVAVELQVIVFLVEEGRRPSLIELLALVYSKAG